MHPGADQTFSDPVGLVIVDIPHHLVYAGMWIFKGSPLKIHISIKFGPSRISYS